MAEKIVDARGKLCPQPLIMTRQALKGLGQGEHLRILIDNEISKKNVERFLSDNGLQSSCHGENGLFTLLVTKSTEGLTREDAESYCTPSPASQSDLGRVYVISSDEMGSGPRELGEILIKAFVNTIKEVQPLPSKIIFYNSGILLTAEGSPLVDSLAELEAAGVEILVCGTCVNYFKKQDLVRVGTISNMFAIMEALSKAASVIKP
jgi:selenium metabolism protein YedF